LRNILIWIFGAFIILSIITLPRNPLQNDDAALYALAAKNTVIHNQWLAQFVTPGDPSSFLDKPPLGIWLLAFPLKVMGASELTVHIPNVIYYLVLLMLLFFSLSYLASKKLALYSTLIAATSFCLVAYSRTPKLDVLLTLSVTASHFLFFAFLKRNDFRYLMLFTLSLAFGFLIKSGFGVLFPVLTILFLMLFHPPIRNKIFQLLLTPYALLNLLLFLLMVGGVLGVQSFSLKDQWLPYLKSITIQSKYNTAYLGLGFHYPIIGFLLLALFPWSPLWLSALKIPKPRKAVSSPLNTKHSKLTLSDYSSFWFWSNVSFLLFFYQQNDLRTFTVFVPPLAILAATKLIFIQKKSKSPISCFLWGLFFLILLGVILTKVILNPVNTQGISLKAAVPPLILFTFSLFLFFLYLWRPKELKFILAFLLICLSYVVLFYQTKPLADAFNSNVTWPKIIQNYRAKGAKFYLYRPSDRPLFFSPDLAYVDFMAGPADKYFWTKSNLLQSLFKERVILLSDTKSLEKLNLKIYYKKLAQDSYSSMILISP